MHNAARRDAPLYDPNDPAIRADPFPLYARLRAEDPVHWSPPLKSWVVTRYDDVKAVALAPQMSPDRLTPFYESLPPATQGTVAELVRYLNFWLVFRDPPDHTRLRQRLGKAFSPAAIEALRPNVEAICTLLLDRLDGRDEADVVRDFAMVLPAYVIMDMLGVERAMLDRIQVWSNDMRLFIGSARARPDKYERARDGAREMAAYFRGVIAERRAAPRPDVLSALIAVREDGALSDDELIATCMLFLFAGHETTTNLIANASLALIDRPEERRRLLGDPALADAAVEEFLRFDGPSNALVRVVAADHAFGGRALKAGDRIFAMINAANRDGAAFAEPDRLDIGRTPNRHLTFGQGIHFCMGAPLARLEGRIAIPALHARYPDMRRAGEPRWIDSIIMRGLEALPMRLGRRT